MARESRVKHAEVGKTVAPVVEQLNERSSAKAPLNADSNKSSESELDQDMEESHDESGSESEMEDPASEMEEPARGAKPGDTKKAQRNGVDAAEIRAAREASETFSSNVFKLQVEEVIKEIAIEEKYAAQARKLLFTVRAALAATSPVGPLHFSETQKSLTTKIPYPSEISHYYKDTTEIKYKFGFVPPEIDKINVSGSWSLHTTIRRPKRPAGIDLMVPMPSSLFDSKDYLDYRYHRKRSFFLAVLATQLAEAGLPVEPRFERFNGHPLKIALQLVPVGSYAKLGKRLTIYLHAYLDDTDFFPARKLAPHRNAQRAKEGPTPIYNWSILSDIYGPSLLRYLHAAAAAAPAFTQTVRLGSLWLQQRSWASDPLRGGFGTFEFAVLLAALLNGGSAHGKKKLLPGYSSYQLFKGAMLYIAEVETISLEGGLLNGQHFTPAAEQGLFFSDCGLNVLANLSPWAPRLLRHDAQLAVDMLNDYSCDRFEALFLQNCGEPSLRFDIDFEIEVNAVDEERLSDSIELVAEIHTLLRRAWGPRYRAMRIVPSSDSLQGSLQSSWPLSSDTPAYSTRNYAIGAILDPENSEKRVSFNGEEFNNDSHLFKEFWGSKASLRRFQDGSIKEAVVWALGWRSITQEAAVYALTRHMDASVVLAQDLKRKLPSSGDPSQKIGAGFMAINSSFQKLVQLLQELRGTLPLRILAGYGTSAELRWASISEPRPFDPSQIAEGLIELETSSRWPASFEAVEKVKSAFLIKIAETMRKVHPKYCVVIGLEPSLEDPSVEAAFAIINTPEGFYFKMRLLVRTPKNEQSKLADLADHTRMITTMVHRYPSALSTTMRLVKLWLERQMLMTHISEPAVELLALYVFANSAPWAPPVSPTTAFMRVIDLLSRWDWRETNLVIDVDRHVGTTDHYVDSHREINGCDMELVLFQSMSAAFAKQRKQDPALTQAPWCISTKLDKAGTMWTKWEPRSRVALVIASRVTTLARAIGPGVQIFSASIADFEVAWVVKSPPSLVSKNKNLVVSDPQRAIINSHNIALDLVRALTKLYKDTLILFYSGSLNTPASGKGHILCGIWNRQILDPIPKLKANVSYIVKQTEQGYILDKDATLAEIERLGSGILERIDIK